MTPFETERRLVETRIQDNFTAAPVKYDNASFAQPVESPFVVLFVESGAGRNAVVGSDKAGRHDGVVRCEIYTPVNTGSAAARILADNLQSLLANISISEGNALLVTGPASLGREGQLGDGLYRLTLSVPYLFDCA